MTDYTLLQFPDRLVLCSDEEITDADVWYNFTNQIVSGGEDYAFANMASNASKVIAGHGSLPFVDVRLIAEIIGWVDVDSLALAHWHSEYLMAKNEDTKEYILNDFKAGYFKAQELNKNKFSEIDIKKAIHIAPGQKILTDRLDSKDANSIVHHVLTMKQQPKQWRVEVETMSRIVNQGNNDLEYKYPETPRITNNTIKILKVIQ